MILQSSQRLPELLFYTKKSYKILQAPIPAPILHVHSTENSTCRRQRALRVLQSSHRRQGDLLEMHPCVLQDIPGNSSCSRDIPETFQTFQSFMTFQPSRQFYNVPVSPGNPPHSSILRLECIFYNSTVRLVSRKLHRVPVGQLQTLQTLHSKKGRCCDIGQDVKMTYFLE